MPCSVEPRHHEVYGLRRVWEAAVEDYCLFLPGMAAVAKVGQRDNDIAWLESRGVIRVEVGEHDKTVAIDYVGGGYRQHPTF
jgi:hypothetical protein